MNRKTSARETLVSASMLGFALICSCFAAKAEVDCIELAHVAFEDLTLGVPETNTAQLKLQIFLWDSCKLRGSEKLRCEGFHVRWSKTVKNATPVNIFEEDIHLSAPLFVKWNEKYKQSITVQFPKYDGRLTLEVVPLLPQNVTHAREIVSVLINHHPEYLYYLTAAVLGSLILFKLGILIVWRKGFRLHLSTCLCMLFAAGCMMAVNSRENYFEMTTIRISNGPIISFDFDGFMGWPWKMHQIDFIPEWSWNAFAADVLIFAGILIAVAIVMEFIFRTRRSQKPLTSPALPSSPAAPSSSPPSP